MESYMIYVPLAFAVLGLVFMFIKRSWVLKQDPGDGKMKEISDYIYEGALAFLKAEYRLLTYFVIGATPSAICATTSYSKFCTSLVKQVISGTATATAAIRNRVASN